MEGRAFLDAIAKDKAQETKYPRIDLDRKLT